MRLELFDEDLLPQHKRCNASEATFDKFTSAAKKAIMAAGQATFYTNNRTNHELIYAPKKKGK